MRHQQEPQSWGKSFFLHTTWKFKWACKLYLTDCDPTILWWKLQQIATTLKMQVHEWKKDINFPSTTATTPPYFHYLVSMLQKDSDTTDKSSKYGVTWPKKSATYVKLCSIKKARTVLCCVFNRHLRIQTILANDYLAMILRYGFVLVRIKNYY